MEISLIGLGGALIGILLGHFLTRSSQHKQWLRDNRKEEFKEVVTALSRHIIEHIAYVASQGSDLPQSRQAYVDSMKATGVVLTDRIYINADLEKTNIPKRYLEVMEHFRENGSEFDGPANKASELLGEIIGIARKG